MTIYESIIQFIEQEGSQWGGNVERTVSERMKCKPSNVGRRLRELVGQQKLEVRYEQINNNGRRYAKYYLFPQKVCLGVILTKESLQGQLL